MAERVSSRPGEEPVVSCPSCRTGAGRARSVVVGLGQRTIGFVCDRCGQRWELTDAITSPSLFTEPWTPDGCIVAATSKTRLLWH